MSNTINFGATVTAISFTGSGSGLTTNTVPRTAIAVGTVSQIVANDGTGALTSIAQVSATQGGTGINTSSSTGLAKVAAGTWSVATLVDADVSASAAITRSKLATGTINQVVINDGSGNLSSEAQLSTVRGGTGINTSSSTGVAKVSAGTWSVATIVDADISSSAAIARSKLAAGTINQVVINSGAGALISEAQLAVSRGGLGADFSGVGSGPFVLTNASGTFSCSVVYTAAATASTVMSRDGSANTAVANLTATSVTAPLINTSSGDLTFTPAGGNVQFGSKTIRQAPVTIAGGACTKATVNLQTTDATTQPIYTYATTSGTKGTSYHITAQIALGDSTGGSNSASISYSVRAKNLLSTLTVGTLVNLITMADGTLANTSVTVTASSQNLIFNVVGLASTTINWCACFNIVEQQF